METGKEKTELKIRVVERFLNTADGFLEGVQEVVEVIRNKRRVADRSPEDCQGG